MHSPSFPIGPVSYSDGTPSDYTVLPSGVIVSCVHDEIVNRDAVLYYLDQKYSLVHAISVSTYYDKPDNAAPHDDSMMLYGAD